MTTNAVDIWLTNITEIDSAKREQYKELLNSSERDRYRRFIVRDAADQFLIARALLRTTLSRYANADFRDWTFETNSYGKPHVSGPQCGADFHFNISHTKGLVACAVSRKHVLGVDVENSLRDMDNLMANPGIFAPSEISTLRQLPVFERRQYFFSLWTLKEAYIKARGMGLAIPLDAFWFDLDDDREVRIRFSVRCPDNPAHWTFMRLAPTEEHMLALAIADLTGKPAKPNIHWTIPLA